MPCGSHSSLVPRHDYDLIRKRGAGVLSSHALENQAIQRRNHRAEQGWRRWTTATDWQHHTIRGAIYGALTKRLGLTVETTRPRELGPNKTGAKGSSTVYRILDLGTGAPPAVG
jgi:Protein of unknown function (DUF3489)